MPSTTVSTRNRAMCRSWLDWLTKQGRSPLTVYQYGMKCEELLTFVGERALADIGLTDLESWIARPRQRRGHGQLGADSTRAKDTLLVRGLLGFAQSHGLLAVNAAVDLRLPRVRNDNPKAIDAATWTQVWCSDLMRPEERVAFGLGFFCGLRREEIARLQPHHVDTKAGNLHNFKRKGDRNSHVSGLVPYLSCARLFGERHPQLIGVPESFLDPLHALVRARRSSPWLLPWGEASVTAGRHRGPGVGVPDGMTSPDQLNGRLMRLLIRCGLPPRAFTPHALRHSFVTYLLQAEVPLQVVSKLSNHSSVDVTLRYVRLAADPLAAYLSDKPLVSRR